MKSRIIFIIFLALMTGCFFGCIQNVEQTTPSGQVAPPVAPVYAQPYRTPGATQPYRTPEPQARPAERQQQFEQPEPVKPTALFDSSIIGEFKNIYGAKGSPKLAIFLNRSLSDEVREWKTDQRAVLSFDGQRTVTSGGATVTTSGPGGESLYTQTHVENPGRTSPGESWMWEFENGFLQPFLDISANIVDRATIMRLTAASSGGQGSAYQPIAVKKVEMDALTGKADLFIEILIRRNPGSKLGYVFKASAKEVNTGIIRANVTSIGWEYGPVESTERVVADSTGYHFETIEPNQLPEVNVIARDLALALMRALGNNWR